MKILSLFDGISCGIVAAQRAGLAVSEYFASEVDKHAVAVSKFNNPEIKHIGDVTMLHSKHLPDIDLLIGGSPCQGFSSAGTETGFEHDGSKLFWHYIRLLKELNPKWFLLENVCMKKEWTDIISSELGVIPVEINSALVSAQNRRRLYWTNIPITGQPEDKGIMLKDILDDDIDWRQCSIIGRRLNNGKRDDYNKDIPLVQTLQVNDSTHKMSCLTTVSKDNLLTTEDPGRFPGVYDCGKYHFFPSNIDVREKLLEYVGGLKNENVGLWLNDGKALSRNFKQGYRIYSSDNKPSCLTANGGGPGGQSGAYETQQLIRTLTPTECEKLQTIPVNYTAHGLYDTDVKPISSYQRKKMLGNAWTVDVIAWILSQIPANECR